MALWTDIIDPAELSGYAREELAAYEIRKGSLAQFLPNREVADVAVRFVMGSSGLVEEARWRAYDAPVEVAKRNPGKRVTLDLPALGQEIPVSEYEQLRLRNSGDDAILNNILSTTRQVVQAVADSMERLRGTVLTTGKATVAQSNFVNDDDFSRAAGHTLTLGTLWTLTATDRLAAIQTLVDVYNAANGVDPGCIALSNRVLRLLTSGDQFKTVLQGGATQPGTLESVNNVIQGQGLPPIVKYDRQTKTGRVTPDDRLYLLPAPVDTDDFEGTELGATFWGQTLTSMDPDFGIAESEQPGIVVGTYKNEKPPIIAEVISDAIGMPVLANADLSLCAKVI